MFFNISFLSQFICKDNANDAQNCCTSFYGKPKIEAICNFLGVVGRLMGEWGQKVGIWSFCGAFFSWEKRRFRY